MGKGIVKYSIGLVSYGLPEARAEKKFLERSHDMFYTPLHYHQIYAFNQSIFFAEQTLKHPMEGKGWREKRTHIGHHLHFSNCQ